MALTKLQPFNIDTTGSYAFANVTATNANLGNAVTANFFIGNGSLLTGLTSSSSNYANYTGTVAFSAQPNITSVGTLTGLTSNGVVDLANTSNVSLGAVGNLHISGGTSGYYLTTDGSGNLSWATQLGYAASYISNGTSNVSAPAVNGNFNISIGGVANVVVVASNGMSVKGNIDLGANYIKGNGYYLTNIDAGTANTANALAVGNSSITISPNSNISLTVAGTANTAVFTSTGANIKGYANVTGNVSAPYFIGNGAFLTGVDVTPSNMSNGNSNVSIAISGGNVITSVNGTANVLIVAKTGANISGYANVTGNVSASYFIGNGSLLTGVATNPANISNGTSNINIPSLNGNVTIGVTGNADVITITGIGINVAGYANVAGNVNASYVKGNGYYLTGLQITTATVSNGSSNVSVDAVNGNITMGVSGNANVVTVSGTSIIVAGNANISGQYVSTVVTGTAPLAVTSTTQVANLNAATAGTVITAAQPNITSHGTLTGLTSNGVVNFANTSNVTLGDAGNLHIAGGTTGYVLQTDGSGTLSWAAPGGGTTGAAISNGTANVRAFLNGNVTVSSAGNANVMTVTGSAVTVVGNVTANYFVGNGAFLTGVDAASTTVNGNSNVAIPTAGGSVITSVNGTANVMIVTKTGANIAGYANITGNVTAPFFIGNGAALTGIALMSSGTSNLIVTTNGNISTSVNGNANIIVVTGTGANVAGHVTATSNVSGSNVSATGQLISTLASGTAPLLVLSTTQVANLNAAVAGVVTTNAQPNITSVGTLTGITSNGVVNLANTSNVTLGAASNLHIAGGANGQVLTTYGNNTVYWATSAAGTGGGGSNILNGTSNVSIDLSGGNVTTSVNGNANIFVVSSTGVNVTGYANITGPANVAGNLSLTGSRNDLGSLSNLTIPGGSSGYVLSTNGSGNLSWVGQSGGGGGATGAIQEFVATEDQTTFTVLGGYNVGSVLVFVNGIQMNNNDYAASNGATVVLVDARNVGDIVRIISSMVSPAININSIQSFAIAMSIAMGM